jgi:selenocysteine-specific elongation factor
VHVVGTAGHVDHGKSTLVHALTGIDPDRLKEEKARQMTIDLGFAWITLPGGALIGIVDVPGHRDFIENMLAGVGGIDAVIFVVAADEGVMPQTREHLAIVDLLQIPTGVIALTKIDLVQDPDWLDLVQLDLAEILQGTLLAAAPLIPVSAKSGKGLDQLQTALLSQLATLPSPADLGRPRLWVDRVFSVSGFGTVVTGTLVDGCLVVGQEIQFQPGGLRARIRGLQSHQQTLDSANPGSRVAVNVSGVDKQAVKRGYLLILPDLITPARLIAVRFRHLPDAPRPLRHNAEVKFYCGAAETIARVRLLDSEMLVPGAEGWLQLELRESLPLLKGDRFILRYPSPGETIGGGQVIDPSVGRRLKRNHSDVIAGLETLARATPAELIVHALDTAGLPLTLAALADTLQLDRARVAAALDVAPVIRLADDLWIGQVALSRLLEKLSKVLDGFHKAEPLRSGSRLESLRQQLGLSGAHVEPILDIAVQRQIISRTRSGTIAQFGFTIQLSKAQRAAIDRLMAMFAAAPYMPPSYKDSAAAVGDDLLMAIIEWGDLLRVAPDVLFTPATLREFAIDAERTLAAEGTLTIKVLRDQFNTSRKYAQAALEYFDSLGITRRKGDDHITGSGDWSKIG